MKWASRKVAHSPSFVQDVAGTEEMRLVKLTILPLLRTFGGLVAVSAGQGLKYLRDPHWTPRRLGPTATPETSLLPWDQQRWGEGVPREAASGSDPAFAIQPTYLVRATRVRTQTLWRLPTSWNRWWPVLGLLWLSFCVAYPISWDDAVGEQIGNTIAFFCDSLVLDTPWVLVGKPP